jgi:type VI protein secretion system component VasA
MSLPPNFNNLVQQIGIELNELNSDLTQSIKIVREVINLFPENIVLMQLYSTLNNYTLFAQNTQRRTQEAIQYLAVSENISEENIQEFGEDLSEQLGRIIEAKIVVSTIKNRLEG